MTSKFNKKAHHGLFILFCFNFMQCLYYKYMSNIDVMHESATKGACEGSSREKE